MKKVVLLLIVACLFLSLAGCKSSDYKKAAEMLMAGDFEGASEVFLSLGEYKDAQERYAECVQNINYNKAVSLLEGRDYESAAGLLNDLGDFKDSKGLLDKCNAMLEAISGFQEAVSLLEQKNGEFDEVITKANELVMAEDKALDESLRPELETAISKAKAVKMAIPEMPVEQSDILDATDEMKDVDYSDAIAELQKQQEAFGNSVKQYALVNAPSEGYVIRCLEKVPGITGIAAATEDNDPNGNLGKAGGYTAAVYFAHENVDQGEVSGDSIIERGTDGGGQIEVYANEADANKRNDYLATFDGSVFASGSHTVIGTVLVRTSDKLKASEQKELEATIISTLTAIE